MYLWKNILSPMLIVFTFCFLLVKCFKNLCVCQCIFIGKKPTLLHLGQAQIRSGVECSIIHTDPSSMKKSVIHW